MTKDCRKWGVGARTVRPDAEAKVRGEALYLADMKVNGMLHAALVTSPVASGHIESLGLDHVREEPGVQIVLSADDLRGANQIGIIFDDQPLLAAGRVRMVGERLALIAADSEEQAWAAVRAAKPQIAAEPGVFDVADALSPNAPKVHDSGNLIKEFVMHRGHMDDIESRADLVIEGEYRIGGQEHAYMEGQGAIVIPGPGGTLTVYSSTQCPFYVRQRICRMTGLAEADVRVVQTVTGGAFGGKEDYPDEPACCAAVLALRAHRPVRLVLPREVDFQGSTKRHRMVVRHQLYALNSGRILGAKVEILVDAGAYAGMSTVVAERANSSCIGPYHVDAVQVSTKVCYTNNLFGGPFRGFGAPQVSAAHEQQMNRLAWKLGLDPVAVRRTNLLNHDRPTLATGEVLPCADMGPKTLDEAVFHSKWQPRWNESVKSVAGVIDPEAQGDRYRDGMGVGTIVYGCSLHHGGLLLDRGGASMILQADGTVNVAIGVTEMGQGALAAARAIASQGLGISQERIRVREVDSAMVPDSGPTVASRATLIAGRAIMDATKILADRLRNIAADLLGRVPAPQLEFGNDRITDPVSGRFVSFSEAVTALYGRRENPAAVGWFRPPDREYDDESGQGGAYIFYAFATQVARVRVDTWTGMVQVRQVTAAHDVGRAIHPPSLEGQIQGGVVQSMGWATMEDLLLDQGVLQNPGFTNYHIPTATDAPDVRIVLLEEGTPEGPYGAKGIGEPSFIPGGAAILGAVSDALGIELTELPLTPQRVRMAVEAAQTSSPEGK
ncbi:MAG: xanthine dehydrogenase family protein [Deltaproteobacteria bacterium]|nr:xanthine dehydrogenase family protein [Deltaproteobacteria bacterium]